jgi:hypothetical protein
MGRPGSFIIPLDPLCALSRLSGDSIKRLSLDLVFMGDLDMARTVSFAQADPSRTRYSFQQRSFL